MPTAPTYGEERTEEEKKIDALLKERVQLGIMKLERKYGTDWVDKIDMDALDLRSARCCVLGQLYDNGGGDDEPSGYAIGCNELAVGDPAEYGFTLAWGHRSDLWDTLQETWEQEINERRTK